MRTCVEDLASLPVAHLYRAMLSPSPMRVACSTAGCPKVSPGVAECPTDYDMAFQDCFHPCLLFRSGSCKWSGLIVDFQIQKHRMLCAIDLLILSSLLLSIFWFCCASFSLTQSIYLINRLHSVSYSELFCSAGCFRASAVVCGCSLSYKIVCIQQQPASF